MGVRYYSEFGSETVGLRHPLLRRRPADNVDDDVAHRQAGHDRQSRCLLRPAHGCGGVDGRGGVGIRAATERPGARRRLCRDAPGDGVAVVALCDIRIEQRATDWLSPDDVDLVGLARRTGSPRRTRGAVRDRHGPAASPVTRQSSTRSQWLSESLHSRLPHRRIVATGDRVSSRRRRGRSRLDGLQPGPIRLTIQRRLRAGGPSGGISQPPLAALAGYSPAWCRWELLGRHPVASISSRRRCCSYLPAIAAVAFFGQPTDWMGGRSYGPRYPVPLLPLMAVAASVLWVRAKLPVSAARPRSPRRHAVAAARGARRLLSRASHCETAAQGRGHNDSESPAKWSGAIGTSSLALNAQRAVRAVRMWSTRFRTPRASGGGRPGDADDHDFAQRYSFSLDLWWLYACYLARAIPAWLAVSLDLGSSPLPSPVFTWAGSAPARSTRAMPRASGAGSPDSWRPSAKCVPGLQ